RRDVAGHAWGCGKVARGERRGEWLAACFLDDQLVAVRAHSRLEDTAAVDQVDQVGGHARGVAVRGRDDAVGGGVEGDRPRVATAHGPAHGRLEVAVAQEGPGRGRVDRA